MNTTSSTMNSTLLHQHHQPNDILPLDFNNVPKLPESHETLLSDGNRPRPVLPVIDLADPDVFSLVRNACEEWGAFQIINHGVPLSLFHETEFHARELFSLPAERKQLAARSSKDLFGYGIPRINLFFPEKLWSEGFSWKGSPVEYASKLWPQDHAKFCEVMEEWQAKMTTISEKLVPIMLGSLGLTHGEDMKWFEPKNECDPTECVLQLNSYSASPDPDRATGLYPHTDTCLIALLNQGSISGLEVYKDGDGWVAVEPVEGALVVNVGDLMHIVSNGKFKSVLHRAVVNNTFQRVSIAYVYQPPWDAVISPLRKLVDFEHPPLYRSMTWKEYVEIKTSDFSKAFESIRL